MDERTNVPSVLSNARLGGSWGNQSRIPPRLRNYFLTNKIQLDHRFISHLINYHSDAERFCSTLRCTARLWISTSLVTYEFCYKHGNIGVQRLFASIQADRNLAWSQHVIQAVLQRYPKPSKSG